jgi:hypothetical protein
MPCTCMFANFSMLPSAMSKAGGAKNLHRSVQEIMVVWPFSWTLLLACHIATATAYILFLPRCGSRSQRLASSLPLLLCAVLLPFPLTKVSSAMCSAAVAVCHMPVNQKTSV